MTSSGLPAVAHGRWAGSLRGGILSGPPENDTMSQRRVPLAGRVLAVVLAAAGVAVARLVDPDMPSSSWVVVPYAAGLSVRLARQAREQERARHVADERIRLAQDVHDVVGHNLAAIKMQADVALHLMRKDPGQAEAALRAISGASS